VQLKIMETIEALCLRYYESSTVSCFLPVLVVVVRRRPDQSITLPGRRPKSNALCDASLSDLQFQPPSPQAILATGVAILLREIS
jgi:hypothetical protein